jgi:hypothetical protein
MGRDPAQIPVAARKRRRLIPSITVAYEGSSDCWEFAFSPRPENSLKGRSSEEKRGRMFNGAAFHHRYKVTDKFSLIRSII